MGFEQIGAIVGLATNAVGLTGKATSTVAAIKDLLENEKTPDRSEAAKLLNALAAELTSANMMNVQLSDALKTLSQELRRQDEFSNEVDRYELFKTGQDAMVYRLKEDATNGQPMHYVCPVCMKRDNLISFITGTGDFKICQTDNEHLFRFESSPVRQPRSSRRY